MSAPLTYECTGSLHRCTPIVHDRMQKRQTDSTNVEENQRNTHVALETSYNYKYSACLLIAAVKRNNFCFQIPHYSENRS